MAGLELFPEQESLLATLGGAYQASRQRQPFHGILRGTGHTVTLTHPGLPQKQFDCYPSDLDELEAAGCIRFSQKRNALIFELTNQGWRNFNRLSGGESIDRSVESATLAYLETSGFKLRHEKAYGRWRAAAEVLWSSDLGGSLTDVGHMCRDAILHFSESALVAARVPEPWPERRMTKERLQRALEHVDSSASRRRVLEALHAYWSQAIEFIMRQDHGAEASNELLPDDARFLVFSTLFLLVEVDRQL